MINQIILFVSLFVTVEYAYAVGVTIATAVIGGLASGFVVSAVGIAINFALSMVISQILAPNFGTRQQQQQDQGVRIQVPPDTTTTIPIVYGEAFLGGKFVDAALRTTDNRVMYYVVAISQISPNGTFTFDLNNMYYGDRKIAFSNTTPNKVVSLTDGDGNVDTKIDDFLFISLYTSDQAGNITAINTGGLMPWQYMAGSDGTSLLMGTGSGIPSNLQWVSTGRRMNGLAFAIVRLGYSQEAGTTSLQPVTFKCKQTLNGQTVAKPGDVWYDYITNPIYGGAVGTQYVDQISATNLNAYSDQVITFDDYDGNPQTQPRYRINGVIDASKSVLENIDQILTACDSWMQYNATNGKWSIVINQAQASTYSFNDNNIIGSITVGSIDITQMPNQIQGKFPDKTNKDLYNYVNLTTPSNLLYPNEPVNKLNVNYDLVNDSVQALYLANRQLEQAREDLLVTIDTTYDGIQVDAGDVVSVTNTAYGWNNKLFRAMQVKEIVNATGLTAQIQLVEYNEAVYDNFDITQYVPAGNSDIPSSEYFSALSVPAVVDSFPYDSTPTFDINVAIPVKGRVTSVILFYTTVAVPTASDWQVLDTQTLSNSIPFGNGTTLTFTDYNLAPDAYYFAYKVANDVASSALSPASTVFNWNPDPANANSFTLSLNPPTLQIPYDGSSVSLTGIDFRLYGSNGQGSVQYVTASDDSDPAFVAGTWRIGGSSTTGTGDIVQTGITFPLPPTDGGTYAQFGTATAMTASPATVFIPVRYKDLGNTVHQVAPATLQAVYAQQGQTGNKTATAYLYQWSTSTPSNPSGTSIFSWSTGASSSYTGGGGWQTTPPANPGTPLIKLWTATKIVSDVFNASTTTVSWASGYIISDATQNGASGIQTADAIVYQWAISIPAAPTGTSTYTWATGLFTAPTGWATSQSAAPSAGFTLWQAKVKLTDSVSATTTTINWTTSQITASGYVGTTNAVSRMCFSVTSLSSLASTPTTITTTGSTSFPANGSWGAGTVWTATVPSASAGQTVWQSEGIYNPTTNNTVWNVPYIASVRFGSLSAISANLGTMTAGTITAGMIQSNTTGNYNNGTWSLGSSETFQGFTSTLAANNNLNGYFAGIFLNNSTTGGDAVALGASAKSGPSPAIVAVNLNGTSTIRTITGISYATVALTANYAETNNVSFSQNAISGAGLYAAYQGNKATGLRVTDAYIAESGVGGWFRYYNTDGSTVKKQLLCADTNYSAYSPINGGKIYITDGNGPFTGFHEGLMPIDVNPEIGDILVNTGVYQKLDVNNITLYVDLSNQDNQKSILGICSQVFDDEPPTNWLKPKPITPPNPVIPLDGNNNEITIVETVDVQESLVPAGYKVVQINAVGEGQINVCGLNGNIEIGDLIVASSIPGKGMKQADDIVRSFSVAKSMESVTFDNPTDVKLIACIYISG